MAVQGRGGKEWPYTMARRAEGQKGKRLTPKMRLVTRQQIPHPNVTAPAVPGFVTVVNAVAILTD